MDVRRRFTLLPAIALLAMVGLARADSPASTAVALLPADVAFDDQPSRGEIDAALDLIAARALARPAAGVRWVDRAAVAARVKELGIDRLGGPGVLAAGRGVGADLVVLPTCRRVAGAWHLRLAVIDPEKADVLETVEGPIHHGGDWADDWADRLAAAVGRSAADLPALRAATPVAVLFFANTTGTDRLDGFGPTLTAAVGAVERPGVRMLRFPEVPAGAGEQRLALAGLTAGAARWQDIARRWVWGEYREIDWQGKPFDDAGIEVSVTVWDGATEPAVLTFRGTAGSRGALAAEVAKAVADAVAAPPPQADPLPPATMAARLLDRAFAIQLQNVGGEWGMSAAWLARWHHELRLLELAGFLDPENADIDLELLRSRWRKDLVAPTGRGVHDPGVSEAQWRAGRAAAWGEHVARFGLAGEWNGRWNHGTGAGDNRTFYHSTAGEFFGTAADVGGLGGESAEALADLRRAEILRRARVLLDARDRAAATATAPAAAPDAAPGAGVELWQAVKAAAVDDPAAARRLIDRLYPPGPTPIRYYHEADIKEIGRAVGDPAWTARLLARLDAPPPKWVKPATRRASTRATTRRAKSKLPPPVKLAPVDGGIAYDAAPRRIPSTTLALAVDGDAWLALTGGARLDPADPDTVAYATPLLWHDGRAGGPPFKLVDPGVGAAVGLARHGPVAWVAGGANGIARFDLHTGETRRYGLADGLPTEVLAAVATDAAGVPTVVSGPDVPPTMATFDATGGGRWIARAVDVFNADGFNPPTPKLVAIDANAAVVAGNDSGVSPFLSLLDRKTGRWTNLLAPLVAHLKVDHDFTKIMFGTARFTARAAVALPGGGFALVHDMGVTRVTDAGDILGTHSFGFDRYFTGFGSALLDADGRHLWIAGNVHRGGGSCLIEVDLASAEPPAFYDVPRSMTAPMSLARQGEFLLVGGETTSGPDVLRFPLVNGSLKP